MKAPMAIMTLYSVYSTIQTPVLPNSQRREAALINELLDGYQKLARPSGRDWMPTNVKLGLSLQDVVGITDSLHQDGFVTLQVWLILEWNDPALTWDIEEYGVDSVRLFAANIWTPDIRLYNSVEQHFTIDWNIPFTVYFDGIVSGISPQHLTVPYEFSGNIFSCYLKFGSWTYDVMNLNVAIFPEIDLSTFNPTTWRVTDTNYTRNVYRYQCCDKSYTDVVYKIEIRKRNVYILYSGLPG